MLISLLLSSLLNTADAVPLQLTQQGRILDNNGAAVTGAHDLTFRIFDAATQWKRLLVGNADRKLHQWVLCGDSRCG